MRELAVRGKGVYIWNGDRILGGNPRSIADALENAQVDFVAVKIHDGSTVWTQQRPAVEEIRKRGILIGAWGYIYLKYNPTAEAKAAIQACQLFQPEFYLVDAESHAKTQFAAAKIFAKALRLGLPKMCIGMNSYWKPTYHPTLPWKELRAVCDFDCPQVYRYGQGSDPALRLAISKNEYSKMSPRLPMSMAAGDMYHEHGWRPEPWQVTKFLSACREDLEIKSALMWSMDQMPRTPELWKAFGEFKWDVGPFNPPPIQEKLTAFLDRAKADVHNDPLRWQTLWADHFLSKTEPSMEGRTPGEMAIAAGIIEALRNPAQPKPDTGPQPLYIAASTAPWLNVREAPEGKVRRAIPKGTRVEVWKELGGWGAINQAQTEWCGLKYLAKV